MRSHPRGECKSGACKECGKKHHTMLHLPKKNIESTKENSSSDSDPLKGINCLSIKAITNSLQLLISAKVGVFNEKNEILPCRMLLDTCSSANFITENFARQLNLPRTRCSVPITSLNDMETTAKYYVSVTFKSLYSDYRRTLNFFAVPRITDMVPSEYIPKNSFNIHPSLKLADPEFHKPGTIEMLLGAGPTLSLFCIGQINLSRNNQDLYLQKSKLGWIIGGGISAENPFKRSKCLASNIDFQLEKFWDIEEFPSQQVYSIEENACQKHFKNHVTRSQSGQYIVALPFKENPTVLGDSETMAWERLNFLLKRFKKDPPFKSQYTEVMNEYIKLGHMSKVTNASTKGYYLPHHAVIKESSNTTKVRVVFDASAKTTSGKSLNDILMTGPTIQDDLFSLLLRFRVHNYVITCDIEKMYRQFLVREEDRQYQKILWPVNGVVQEFQLNTVTFGGAPSPYLAIACLHQLAQDENDKFPLAAQALTQDTYVDNILTGTKTINEGQKLCRELNEILHTCGANLRQWASNHIEILSDISEKHFDKNFQLDHDNPLKTLGISWNAQNDTFVYTVKTLPIGNKITKRSILSEIAKIFDPLGLLGPVILYAKKIMQEIWQARVEWDESIPSDIHYSWTNYCMQLNSLQDVSFKRQICLKNSSSLEIHGFCDASEIGYGACIYVRSKNTTGEYSSSLLCSKSRVAPLKTRSLPRLELCGAHLLANLYEISVKSLKINIDKTYFWSDSTIALHWIKTPSNLLKTFVANRVTDIQLRTNVNNWHHVRSEENPADALSRGQLPIEWLENPTWLNGPEWLKLPETEWPLSKIPSLENVPECRIIKCLLVQPETVDILCKFSSFTKLKRTVSWMFRVLKKYRRSGCLQVDELKRAEITIIRLIQRREYASEIKQLGDNKPLPENNKLASLDPFLDNDSILRVGGRIRKAMIPFCQRHPIILPRGNHVTDLIITENHTNNFHSGIQTTLYNVRQRYWPIDGKNQTRRVIRKCVTCFRAKPPLCSYKMGNLPSVRINQARPFCHVGVDYCGPFFIKQKKYRNRINIKSYIAIFICMVTKAVHIELVSDISTDTFLAALRRFIGRRGIPQKIYSDNGSNFCGANNKLVELYSLFQSDSHR